MPKDLDIDVFEALRRTAHDYGVKQLAALMGMPIAVLYNKLNQNGEHHKPTLADTVQIMHHTGKRDPLIALCRQFDGAFVPLPDLSHLNDNALLEIVNRIHAEGGHVFQALNDALEKDGISTDESRRIDAEVDDWVAAILELRTRTRFMAGRTEG